MPMIRLRPQQANLLHLAAQGLLAPPRRRACRADVVDAITRMGLLQIDTIHVVARSPYLVLFSRLGDYRTHWLEESLADGAIFETWAHEACFAPAADYALHRCHVQSLSRHWAVRSARRTHATHAEGMDRLLAQIRARGPMRSADFSRDPGLAGAGKNGGWWGWKDEKRWLEAWFVLGELMVARRENFQRVYDLSERVIANAAGRHAAAAPPPDVDTVRRQFIVKAVHALGITRARWVTDYYRMGRRLKDADLEPLVAAGALLRIEVDGWASPGYVHPAHASLLQRAAADGLRATHSTLLSPFDPVVWDRERASAMFGFDYRIECYVPAPKRTYGYYVLPILRRGRLVGRLDAKAHRGDGVFEIKAIFLQPGIKPSAALLRDLAGAIRACACWHQTPQVVVGRSEPAALAAALQAQLT